MSTYETKHSTLLFALRGIFGRLQYVLLVAVVSFTFFTFVVWMQNLRFVGQILTQSDYTIAIKISLLVSLLEGIGTNFTVFSAITTIIIALLFGINIAMLVYVFQKRKIGVTSNGFFASVAGTGSGILGTGCAACGSLILYAILPAVSAASIIAFLPFKGTEFSLLSIGLILISIILLAKKISEPLICNSAAP